MQKLNIIQIFHKLNNPDCTDFDLISNITNTNFKMDKKHKHKCGTCGKTFQHKKKKYRDHILFCEELAKCKMIDEETTGTGEDNEEEVISQKDMYKLVQYLTKKYSDLEDEVKVLRAYVQKTKKRINVMDYLNDSPPPELIYSDWMKNITVSIKEIEMVFKFKYLGGLDYILQNNLPLTNVLSHPIRAFNQKKNMFYVYDGEKWIMMDNIMITDLIRKLNVEFVNAFFKWKNANIDKFNDDDDTDFHDECDKNRMVVLGGKKSADAVLRHVKSSLYNYLKCNLKDVIKYEFTF